MRHFSPRRLLVAGGVLLLAVAAALWLVPSDDYIFLPDHAKAVAPLVHVQGEKPDRGSGGIYLVDVLVRRANLLERIVPGIRDGSTLVPESAIEPPGVSQSEREQADLQAMTRSQDIGAAVALEELHYPVRAVPTGVLVDAVFPGMPAVGKLRQGDVITAVDGTRVRGPEQLRRRLTPVKPGETVDLTVRNGKDLRRESIRTTSEREQPDRALIGIGIEQAATIDLPVRITIDTGDIGGPSAGLAFALDVMEELGRDVDRGYKVAATGELSLDGKVHPVGGLKQKTIGARNSHVDVLLAPAGENAAIARHYAGNVTVVSVHTLHQALHKLATLPRHR